MLCFDAGGLRLGCGPRGPGRPGPVRSTAPTSTASAAAPPLGGVDQ